MTKLRVVHLTLTVSRLGGGLFESVRHLSQSVYKVGGIDLSIVAPADARSAEDAHYWNPIPTRVHAVRGLAAFGFCPGLLPDLLASNADVLHLHDIWKYQSMAADQWSRRTRRPLIVSLHGMLEPWALQHSRLKKRLAGWLYVGSCLRNAMCLRATSMMEVESIRAAGFRNPVALIPNGVEMPPLSAVRELPLSAPSSPASDLRPPPSDVRTALFLSRIHSKKGLLNLVEAWRQVSPVGWRLAIVGPDEKGHKADVMAAVQRAGLEGQIHFPGEAWGDGRWQFYRDADLFVLPTFSENFGLVIAEALACRVPVITTQATPWEEIETKKCGWWIETGVEPLVAALKQALATPSAELHAMGERGRTLVTDRYAWQPIGRMMAETYYWMVGQTGRPPFVVA